MADEGRTRLGPARKASSPKRTAENGASSMALTTTAFPAASAAPPFRLNELMPPFQVEMAATTP